MTVYADVLIFLNLFVNFFILQLTSKICKDGYRLFRMILAAFVGSIFSLYIFLPQSSILVESLFKFTVSSVIVLICFGFDSIKSFLRRTGIFFLVTFLYGGLMLVIWTVLKPNNMAINNGVIYLDISPTILITATVLSYLIISLIRRVSNKQAALADRYSLTLTNNGSFVKITALADTGNSLSDSITGKPVIIIENKVAKRLNIDIPSLEAICTGNASAPNGFRMIPYSFVGGMGMLPAFKIESATVEGDEKKVLSDILIAVSNSPLGEDYNAIINPEILR